MVLDALELLQIRHDTHLKPEVTGGGRQNITQGVITTCNKLRAISARGGGDVGDWRIGGFRARKGRFLPAGVEVRAARTNLVLQLTDSGDWERPLLLFLFSWREGQSEDTSPVLPSLPARGNPSRKCAADDPEVHHGNVYEEERERKSTLEEKYIPVAGC